MITEVMTHYERLNVPANATREEIKHAFRRMALKTHPDLKRGRSAQIRRANAEFSELAKAYRALMDAAFEREQDSTAQGSESAHGSRTRPPQPPPVSTRPATPSNAALVDDLTLDIESLRRRVWEEPRRGFITQTIFFALFVILMPLLLILALWSMRDNLMSQWPLAAGSILALAGAGLYFVWATISLTLRIGRIRASGGWRAFAHRAASEPRRWARWRRARAVTRGGLARGMFAAVVGVVALSIVLAANIDSRLLDWRYWSLLLVCAAIGPWIVIRFARGIRGDSAPQRRQ